MQIRHNPLSGGYCGEVPPLPIPNREVKLTCADGTAMQCGRVGSRLLLSRASDFERFLRLFCFSHSSAFLSPSFFPQLLTAPFSFFTFLPSYLFTFTTTCIVLSDGRASKPSRITGKVKDSGIVAGILSAMMVMTRSASSPGSITSGSVVRRA